MDGQGQVEGTPVQERSKLAACGQHVHLLVMGSVLKSGEAEDRSVPNAEVFVAPRGVVVVEVAQR